MTELLQPIGFAVLTWWLSTGVILWLIGLPKDTFKWTALAATAIVIVATIGLFSVRNETGIAAAYLGFAIGIALWAWHEVMFLLGYLSGPRKTPCPPNLGDWPRFVVSSQTVIYHELAIAIHASVLLALTYGAANQIAAWTFFLLWGMRLSAKLIIFFGAPNISDIFLPAHLAYLKSYFKKSSVSAFFPLAITLVTMATAVIIYHAAIAPSGSFQSLGLIMLGSLATLAVLEHWALVAPLPDAALWKWALRSSSPSESTTRTSEWRK